MGLAYFEIAVLKAYSQASIQYLVRQFTVSLDASAAAAMAIAWKPAVVACFCQTLLLPVIVTAVAVAAAVTAAADIVVVVAVDAAVAAAAEYGERLWLPIAVATDA